MVSHESLKSSEVRRSPLLQVISSLKVKVICRLSSENSHDSAAPGIGRSVAG